MRTSLKGISLFSSAFHVQELTFPRAILDKDELEAALLDQSTNLGVKVDKLKKDLEGNSILLKDFFFIRGFD